MKKYEVSFVFFISLGETEEDYNISVTKKNQFIKELNKKTELRSYDAYEDGEDWCIDCIAYINAKSIKDTEKIMENVFGKLDYTFDYHYIKGIDNSDYWQP